MSDFLLDSAQATEALGARLAAVLPPSGIIYLQGELGTGKTTLVRGLLRALGQSGTVRSPTYTLVEPYTLDGRHLVHLDLYRLADPDELEWLGLRDFLDSQTVLLVEWPERGWGVLPAADLIIALSYAGSGRHCRLQPVSASGAELVARLAGA